MGEMDESAKKDSQASSENVESQQPVTSATDLKTQAQVVREISSPGDSRSEAEGASFLVRSCYTLLTFTVLFAAILLLSLSSVRQSVITHVHEQYAEWTASASSSEIFRLPPPPPRVIEKEVVVHTPPVMVPTGDQSSEVLYADGQGGEASSLGGKKPEVILEKTKDSISAYDLLSKESPVVRELKEGKHPQYKFVEWRTVKNSAPVFWIDLLASDSSGGPQLHLVWSVDLETGELSALSQAARDLESGAGK